MSCNCVTYSANSSDCGRRYMRIDNIIFDKKYVSKIVFTDEYFSLFFKGDCKEHKFPLSYPKSTSQIAAYQLELNNCGNEDVIDMTTNDHSMLNNLDVENQHPIKAIVGLEEQLNNKVDTDKTYWTTNEIYLVDLGLTYKYMYYGTDPQTIPLAVGNISNCAELFVRVLIALKNNTELPQITDDVLNTLKINNFNVQLTMEDDPCAYFMSSIKSVVFGFQDGLKLVYDDTNTYEYKSLNTRDIVDNLTTDSIDKPLSASQGKNLKTYLDKLSDEVDEKAPIELVEQTMGEMDEKATYTYVNNKVLEKQDKIVPIVYNSLPSASTYPNRIYFVSDKSCFAYSDGNQWWKLKLESF